MIVDKITCLIFYIFWDTPLRQAATLAIDLGKNLYKAILDQFVFTSFSISSHIRQILEFSTVPLPRLFILPLHVVEPSATATLHSTAIISICLLIKISRSYRDINVAYIACPEDLVTNRWTHYLVEFGT